MTHQSYQETLCVKSIQIPVTLASCFSHFVTVAVPVEPVTVFLPI